MFLALHSGFVKMRSPLLLRTAVNSCALLLLVSSGNAQEPSSPAVPNASTTQSAETQTTSQEGESGASKTTPDSSAAQPGQQGQSPPQSIQDQVNNQVSPQPAPRQNAPSQRRNQLDRNVGTAGTRLKRSPNIVGDFIGFSNTANFVANDPFFAPRSVNIAGGSLSGLAAVPVGPDFSVTIPASASAFGEPLGQDITLNFDGGTGVVTPQSLASLSPSQQQALLSFMNRQGSSVAGLNGTIDPAQLANLTATTTGPNADLSLDAVNSFQTGGFAPDAIVSLPRAGDQIARFKAAEQNSAIPRDRILFNYALFNGVPGPGGADQVNRFVPGFEKTLFDGDASVTVRMPFAGTFDNYQTVGPTGSALGTSDTELGNLTFVYKQIVASGENSAISAGLGLELPTAADQIYESDAFLITRQGECVMVSPFVAGLWNPTERSFFQAFTQVAFDTNGEQMSIVDKFGGMSSTGRIHEATTLFVDFQTGYWVYRNDGVTKASQISGLAGLIELHLNQTIEDTDTYAANVGGVPFSFGDPNGSIGVANLTTGITTEFGNKSNLMFAYVAPLTDRDRQFDTEFQVAFNYYFDNQGSPSRIPSRFRR
jgi:uncharacterized low-complexity protein